METLWKHADAFPIIARVIADAHRELQRFVTAQEIATRLLQDDEARNLVEVAREQQEEKQSLELLATNMVAWFSQRITVGESEWAKQFERTKINDLWAYKPDTAASQEVARPTVNATSTRVFGHVKNVSAGTHFSDRKSLSAAGVHRPIQAGISFSETQGADSIVASGGYEDDVDYGDMLIYTGMGGNESGSGKQIANQNLDRGNLGLAVSCARGLPVRVTRGSEFHDSAFSPKSGYRYDGLYFVESYWKERGKSGFVVWRYRLVKSDDSPELVANEQTKAPTEPLRKLTTIQRIVRSNAVVQMVKEFHGYHCQVCGDVLLTPSGRYAEGAHIRPLGKPHNGPDVSENVLCLCPNHHVLFDCGAFAIADDLTLIDSSGKLRTVPKHKLDVKYLQYHRSVRPVAD
jgi:putative restriction endonuclease